MAYDADLEGIYASVVIDQKFDPEVMLRGAPSAEDMIARSYMTVQNRNVAPEPGATAVELPQTFDGFRFSAGGKIHGYHAVKSMSRCGKKFIGDELLANVVVGVTPDEHLCRICWHEHHAKPETVVGEVVEVVDEDPEPCPDCGSFDGPWLNHDRPKSNAALQSGCPTCGACF